MKKRSPSAYDKPLIAADYAAGMQVTAIMKKWNLYPAVLYATIKEFGVQHRSGEKRYSFCVVCGKRMLPPKSQRGSVTQWNMGAWREAITCGDVTCRNIVALRPELVPDDHLSKRWAKPKKKVAKRLNNDQQGALGQWTRPEVSGEVLDEIYTHEECSERTWEGQEDERGADITLEVQTNVWGRLHNRVVAMKLSGEPEPIPSIALKLRRKETSANCLVRLYFGGDREFAEQCDVIVVWQCPCDERTNVVWETLDDIPTEKGIYCVCPRCGAHALEIE